VVQERDGLGDNLPSDYLIRVQQGGFYGWPYAYIGKHPQPGFAQLAPEEVEATTAPDLLFQAHSSLLDLVFYEGDLFPAEYKGSLFVAIKGSWNRSIPTGYKVARVPFKDGKPEGYHENFATGFRRRDPLADRRPSPARNTSQGYRSPYSANKDTAPQINAQRPSENTSTKAGACPGIGLGIASPPE
jgi:glucose/arabinose dehydrogenase